MADLNLEPGDPGGVHRRHHGQGAVQQDAHPQGHRHLRGGRVKWRKDDSAFNLQPFIGFPWNYDGK